ncbi:MAG TPA: class I SAM-dependent methyltransferase [Alphaproteobacteria bacterium]|nr:class I SAM-dependent methyltransferase [Alphaproteobacteria bacterium]
MSETIPALGQSGEVTGAELRAVNAGRCPFCQGADFARFTANAYDLKGATVEVVECRHCRVAWQWPMGTDAGKSGDLMRDCHEAAAGFWSDEETESRTSLQARFIANLRSPGDLLDIGGADGRFAVQAAKLGWNCIVIDPAFPSRRLSDRAVVVNGLVSELPQGLLYDVVTMWAVVEHVPDYVSLMREAFTRLRPGGKLVIETLNYQSLQRLREGANWWGFQADHRWYLSPGIYRDHCKEIGFSAFEIAPLVLRDHWRGPRHQFRAPLSYIKEGLRIPRRARLIFEDFKMERKARRSWPEWCALPIQTVVATK